MITNEGVLAPLTVAPEPERLGPLLKLVPFKLHWYVLAEPFKYGVAFKVIGEGLKTFSGPELVLAI